MHKFFTFSVSALILASAIPAPARSTSMPSCSSGDPVVWENSGSKVYHMQGDSYFGKTKHGRYACRSAADSAGYHASGSKSSSTPTAAPSAMPTAKSKHHRHSKTSPSPEPGGAGASPNAGSVPTPAST